MRASASIGNSRKHATELLATTIASLDRKPSVVVSGSAIGYYGNSKTDSFTEQSPAGEGFLADVCREWEAAAAPVRDAGVRLVTIRTGTVLGRRGGMLGRLLPLYRLGMGGRTGRGDQWLSWISLTDEIGAILFALGNGALRVRSTSRHRTPCRTRNSLMPSGRPSIARRCPDALDPLRLVYGRELVENLLLGGQRVVPEALEGSGFTFEHPTLEGALRHELDRVALVER